MHLKRISFLAIILFLCISSGLLLVRAWALMSAKCSKNRKELTIIQMRYVAMALEVFRTDTGRYPSSAEGLSILCCRNERAFGCDSSYLTATNYQMIVDGWGMLIKYRNENNRPVLVSASQDRMFGTDDDIVFLIPVPDSVAPGK